MANIRLPRAVCKVVGEVVTGSHSELNALYQSAGVPGEPPNLPHPTKWKEWLFRAGNDPSVDGLSVLGSVLEEFMDLPRVENYLEWEEKRDQVVAILESTAFAIIAAGEFFRLGR
jgi:hypothetical protein